MKRYFIELLSALALQALANLRINLEPLTASTWISTPFGNLEVELSRSGLSIALGSYSFSL